MLNPDIEQLVHEKFGIKKFHNNKITIIDEETKQKKQIKIVSMWIADINYESGQATMAYLRTKDWSKAIFLPLWVFPITHQIDTSSVESIYMNDVPNPVSQALQNIDIIHDDAHIIFPSGMYAITMKVYTFHMITAFEYMSGPEEYNAPSMNALWNAINQSINHIVHISENEVLTKFVNENWWTVPKK